VLLMHYIQILCAGVYVVLLQLPKVEVLVVTLLLLLGNVARN
jgi:hypothetical protein